MAISQSFVTPLLRGCGQMLFQPSALTGAVFLVLIFSQSAAALALCLAGVLGATLCAYVLEHPRLEYFRGEGGFNGGLFGLAMSVYFDFNTAMLLLAFAGGAATGMVRAGLVRVMPAPPFTAPFILVGWLVIVWSDLLGLAPSGLVPAGGDWAVDTLANNAAQVIFQLDPWVGAFVFAGVWLHSRQAALWVLAASALVWVVARILGMPEELAGAGLLGYNALILAAALQQRDTRRLLAGAGVVVSVWLSWQFFDAGFTPLSAPFVLSAWLVIAAESVLARHRA